MSIHLSTMLMPVYMAFDIDSIATKVSLSEVQTCCELRWCRQQRLWLKRPGAGAKMGQQLYLGGFEMVPAVSCFGSAYFSISLLGPSLLH